MTAGISVPLWFQAGAAFVISASIVAIYRIWAVRNRVLDHPNARSAHRVPTPRGGGVGIAAALGAGALYWFVAGHSPLPTAIGGYLLAGSIVAGISLADDLKGLPALLRLGAHFLAGIILLIGAHRAGLLQTSSASAYLPWLVLLAVWMPAWANAFNFMDGIDGIAGLQAVVVGVGWVWLGGASCAGGMGAILAGSCAGFLIFNWAPARIFMGDVGSAFVGFTIGTLPILAALPSAGAVPLGRGLAWTSALAWPFAFDTAVTLARRWRRGENLLQSHANHLYQGLARSGLSHRTVALLYGCLAAVGGVAAACWIKDALPGWLAAAAIALLASALVRLTYLRHRY